MAETELAHEQLVEQPAERRRRHRRSSGDERRGSAGTRRRCLRTIYFTLAALWGCTSGVTAMLAALNASGAPITFDVGVGLALGLALAAALLGGIVAARAYRGAVE